MFFGWKIIGVLLFSPFLFLSFGSYGSGSATFGYGFKPWLDFYSKNFV